MNVKIVCSLLLAGLLPLVSGAQDAAQQQQPPRRLTWEMYHTACKTSNSNRDANFEQVKGQTIVWRGKITGFQRNAAILKKWSRKVVSLEMTPSGGWGADLDLRIPQDQEEKLAKFAEDDVIVFKGKIMYLGTRLTNHIVEVEAFKKYVPRRRAAPRPSAQ